MRSVMFPLLLLLFQGPQAPNPASIAGVVVLSGTSTPIAAARVSVGTAVTTSDENGRFELKNLQPGRYTVTAFHASYVFGANIDSVRRGQSTTITLGPGETIKDVVVGLIPK